MKLHKKLLPCLVAVAAVLVCLFVLPTEAEAAEVTSGTCGENLTWTFDAEGTLTISGTGEMKNYDAARIPWYGYESSIKTVILESGVTSIGESAFRNCSSLSGVTIPDSVTNIGSYAFSGCSSLDFNEYDNAQYLGNAHNPYYALIHADDASTQCQIHNDTRLVASRAFEYCQSLTDITIPDSVTSIGNNAFLDCGSLTGIWVNENNAYYSSDTRGILFNKDKTVLIQAHGGISGDYTIPNSVTSICDHAFYNCTRLTGIAIPEGVEYIGLSAFGDCVNLISVNIPSNCGSIGYTFAGCSSLTNVTISSGVHCLGHGTFAGCANLTSIILPGSLEFVALEMFSGCSKLTNVTIGDGISKIDPEAFGDCNSLTSIAIPESVTTIYEAAFWGCSSLTDVYYNGTAEQWARISFGGNNQPLTNAEIHYNKVASGTCGENLTWTLDAEGTLTISGSGEMENYSPASPAPWASNQAEIKTVILEEGITNVGGSAFRGCSGLTEISTPDSVTKIGNSAFYGCTGLTSVTIPDGVTEIGASAFRECANLTSVVIGQGVTTIGAHTFNGCISLNDITIPDSVTSVGASAFLGCTSLKSIIIPEGVSKINRQTFSGCSGLTTVTIPGSVTEIADYAFEECFALKCILFTGTEEQWNAITIGAQDYLLEWKARHYNAGGHIVEEVHGCKVDAFYCVTCEKTIAVNGKGGSHSFENGVCTACGTEECWNYDLVFNGANATVTITGYTGPGGDVVIPETIEGVMVTEIAAYAFDERRNVTSVTIPDSVTTIGNNTFQWCISLTSVSIPDSVISIGDGAFRGCENLTGIWVDSSNPNYSSDEKGVLFNKDKTSFVRVPQGLSGEYIIPESITSIGVGAFSDCRKLTSISIPSTVTTIGKSAFANCYGLTSVTIPNSVTTIGDSAFWGCGVTSITIPNSVTTIGDDAFVNCGGLTSITIPNSVTTIGNYVFSACSKLEHILYTGTEEQWNVIQIGANEEIATVTRHYNATGDELTLTQSCRADMLHCSICAKIVAAYKNGGTHSFENGICTACGTAECWKYTVNQNATITITGYTGTEVVVAIPDQIEKLPVVGIGASAFRDSKLTTIYIPNTVDSIGDIAFYNCTSLHHVLFAGSEEQWNTITIGMHNTALTEAIRHNNATGREITTSVSCMHTSECCSTCDSIVNVYTNGSTHSYTNNVCTTCGAEECWQYTVSKDGKATITSFIGSTANVVIPSALEGFPVVTIGDMVFLNNGVITTVVMPQGIVSVGTSAFAGCGSLHHALYLGTQEQWDAITFSSYNDLFVNATRHCNATGEEITVAVSCTVTAERCSVCDCIANVYDNGGLHNFVDRICSDCGAEEDWKYVIANDGTVILVSYTGTATSIVVPESIEGLPVVGLKMEGAPVFQNNINIIDITLPISIKVVGHKVFDGCESLQKIYYSGSEKDWQEVDVEAGNGKFKDAKVYYNAGEPVFGDIDGDREITTDDAIYLLLHTMFGDAYPVNAYSDFDADGDVTTNDAVYLLLHSMFGDAYPLQQPTAAVYTSNDDKKKIV